MASALNDVLLHAFPDLVLLVRRDGVIVAKCGGGDIEATRERGDLEGSSLQDVWPSDIADHLLNLVRKALKGRACVVGRYRHIGRTYEVRTQPVGIDRVMLMVRAPWSAAAEAASATGANAGEKLSLKSREVFARELTEAVESSRLREMPFALMALHIGGLAAVENTLGTAAAERALAVAMERLSTARKILGAAPAALPPLARLDTDLFAVVLKDVAHRSAVTASAEHARRSLAESISVEDRALLLSPIVAVAFFPGDGSNASELLSTVSGVIEDARGLGRQNTVVYASEEKPFDAPYVADLEREIRSALEQRQLELHYQPVVQLVGQRTLSLDAAITWMQPMRGPVAAEHFLQLMQITDLGQRLDDWLLDEACRDLTRLTDSGYTRPNIAFAPGPQLLRSPTLAKRIARAVNRERCDARRLELYVPESTLASGACREQLIEVRRLGVRVFADGFGKGGLSLSDLETLPLEGVRIDRSFIDRLETDARARAACRSVIALAQSFDMQCVAAGVESTAQLDLLREIGCLLAQGPLFCAPRPLHRFFDEDSTASFNTSVM
jgi:predicted signal transduction protein with EAL and GGDEF domain